MIVIRVTEAGWVDCRTHKSALWYGTKVRFYTRKQHLADHAKQKKMPLSMKPAESISQHAIRNASTAEEGLNEKRIFLSLWSSKTPAICVKEKYFQLVISA